MDGDLSLSQSLGGLRIANPDAASSPGSSSTSTSIRPSLSQSLSNALPPPSTVTPDSSQSNGLPPSIPSGDLHARRLSTLDFDPSSYSTEKISLDRRPHTAAQSPPASQPAPSPSGSSGSIPRKQPSQSARRGNRQSATALPHTYQAQQQAQFPQYPAMIPQSQRPTNQVARPSSVIYGGPGGPAGLPPRDSSYRLHREGSEHSLSNGSGPRKHAQRAAMAEHQAGVPSREEGYSDRAYKLSQKMPAAQQAANGAFPPRRSSKGVGQQSVAPSRSYRGTEGAPPGNSSEEWQERGAAVGVRQERDGQGRMVQKPYKKGVKDFHFGRTLGEGSYSTVLLATDRGTLKEYAIKVLDKRHIIKEKKVKYVNIEKDTLNRLTDHPGVVRLYFTFQDERSLYFVLDLATGGELLGVLKRMTTFDEACTRFYASQILDTIEYMHAQGVIHRDLKPENVLLDDRMHIKITDFGTAKILGAHPRVRTESDVVPLPGDPLDGLEENRANSFVGTAEYVSPELLTDKNACKASDLWAFGCIVYQLLAGRPPFKAANEYLTFQKIVALDYQFPKGFPLAARDLVERLLVLDPARRLTIDHIKNHEFFDGITWGKSLWELKAPPLRSYQPQVAPIKLGGAETPNGTSSANNLGGTPVEVTPSHSTKAVHIYGNGNGNGGQTRPSPRVVTDLPPPSPLDIEWSPVLTKNNERILKLGNQLVLNAPLPKSPPGKDSNGTPNGGREGGKFARFFGGGSGEKKRPRMVLVTTSARLIIAAADGHEKKSKFECSLLGPCDPKKQSDSKGLWFWSLDAVSTSSYLSTSGRFACTDFTAQSDRHLTFEDPKPSSTEASTTSAQADEWLAAVNQAITTAQAMGLYDMPDEANVKGYQSAMSSSTNTLDISSDMATPETAGSSRNTLQKLNEKEEKESKGFKRFSKRQSKSGLATVF